MKGFERSPRYVSLGSFFMAIYQFSHLLKKTFRTDALGWELQNPPCANACAQCIFLAFGKNIGGHDPKPFLVQAGAELVQKWRYGTKRRQKRIIFAYYIG